MSDIIIISYRGVVNEKMDKKERSEFVKKLFALVLPIAFQQFMLALVNASDALMLGALDQNSMSAVSLAGQVAFVENLFFATMTIGLSMIAAQYWGKGDKTSVEKIFAYVFGVTLIVSLAFFVATVSVPEHIMKIFTKDSSLIEGGKIYLRSVSLSFLLTGISQIYLCAIKNTGKAGLANLISSVSVVINIVLNAIFIFGLFGCPSMEIAGAAYATVIARAVEVICCVAVTLCKNSVKLRFGYIVRADKALTKLFWKHTLPVLGNEAVWGLGFTSYSVIIGHLGGDAVAANSVASIARNLIVCFSMGLASGGGIMVGNELGAGRTEKAKAYGRKLTRMSIVAGVISGAVLLALSPLIIKVVDLEETAIVYLKGMLIMCSYYVVGQSVNMTTISGIFCAGGDSRFGLICDAITLWVFVIPSASLAAFVFDAPVLWVYFIICLDEIVKLPAVYRHYKKYLWVKDLTVKQEDVLK